jgi:hypothetical protein
MDRPQRLQEIFAGDEALLELDTQLTTKMRFSVSIYSVLLANINKSGGATG